MPGTSETVNAMKESRHVGRHIVSDPKICHGQPTFQGTRILVADVLDQVAEGLAWESIIEEWHGSVTPEAIAEAVMLAGKAFLDHAEEYTLRIAPA